MYLANAGVTDLGHYPYFDTEDWTAGGSYNGKNAMGAAFNFNYLHHEPGAYAHNRYYAKRLLYDSIDYLDNASLDQSVGSALDALVGADTYGGDTLTQTEVDATKMYLDGDSETAGIQRP